MTFSITLFALSWIWYLLFADKSQFFRIVPTCYTAMFLACLTDLLTRDYPLWEYPAKTMLLEHLRQMFHDFGIYPIVTYLFLQTIPKVQTFFKVIRHFFYWSLFALVLEVIAIKTGSMKYGLWWNMKWSYAADWLLYAFFYVHHKWRMKYTGGVKNDISYHICHCS